MSYTKQNFKDGQTLKAEHLNKIEDYIATLVGANEEELQAIVNAALQNAKDSGEFDGADGVSPTVKVAAISGGHRVTITDASGSKTFDVMNGTGGTGGGADGVSPTVSVATITGGHRITITDKNGTKTVDVMDGINGTNGKTPVKGTDYFTETDKAEMVNSVLAALPVAEGASF